MGTKLWVFFSIIATVLVTTAVISYGPGMYKMSEDFVCAPYKEQIVMLERKVKVRNDDPGPIGACVIILVFLLFISFITGAIIMFKINNCDILKKPWLNENILQFDDNPFLWRPEFRYFQKDDKLYVWFTNYSPASFKTFWVNRDRTIEVSKKSIEKFLTLEEIVYADEGWPSEDVMRALFAPEVSEDLKKLMFAVGTPEDEQIGVVVKNDSHVLVAIKRGEYVDRMKSFPELDETKMFKMLTETEKTEEFETFLDLKEILGNKSNT